MFETPYPEVHAERGVEFNRRREVGSGSVERNRKLNGFFLQHTAARRRNGRGHGRGQSLTVSGGPPPAAPGRPGSGRNLPAWLRVTSS